MMHRSRHRAITLIEVLAALVIIAMLAGVCVPMLRSAASIIGEPQQLDASEARLDLEALADMFVMNPTAFGVESLDELTMVQIGSPDSSALSQVSVVRLTRDDETEETEGTEWNHGWLVFREGGNVAIRFREPAPRDDSKEASP